MFAVASASVEFVSVRVDTVAGHAGRSGANQSHSPSSEQFANAERQSRRHDDADRSLDALRHRCRIRTDLAEHFRCDDESVRSTTIVERRRNRLAVGVGHGDAPARFHPSNENRRVGSDLERRRANETVEFEILAVARLLVQRKRRLEYSRTSAGLTDRSNERTKRKLPLVFLVLGSIGTDATGLLVAENANR